MLWNDEKTACDLIFPDQTDRWSFTSAAQGRTAVSLQRDGQVLATTAMAPAAPRLVTERRVFTDRLRIEVALPGVDQEVRYTRDGSDPTPSSPFYEGPIEVSATTTLKFITVARRWAFGEQRTSAIATVTVTKQDLRPADASAVVKPGLDARLYQGFWNSLPDFTALTPVGNAVVPRVVLPPGTATKGFGVVLEGLVQIPADGVYAFGLENDDAARLWIGDTLVVDNDGQHVVRSATGEIALKAGAHRLRIAACDSAIKLGTGTGDGSWAFRARWAPAGAALQDLPAEALGRLTGADLAAASFPTVAARADLRAVAGLEHRTYDRTGKAGTADFLAVEGVPLTAGLDDNTGTTDSHADLLHVWQGYLQVPHAGVYELALDPNVQGEIRIGDVVAARTGTPGANASQPVQLAAGPVAYTVKLGKGRGQVRWKGPGQDWQSIGAADVVRELRPLPILAGRPQGGAAYEVFGPTAVTFGEVPAGLTLVASTDGSEPATPVAGPLNVSAAGTLRARYLADGKPVGAETRVILAAPSTPTANLIGWWSADRLQGTSMVNGAKRAGNLDLPEGTQVVDDPVVGKALQLQDAGKVILGSTGILANELTLSFRLQVAGDGTLVRYGYAHSCLFINQSKNGSLAASGGWQWSTAKTKDGTLNDGAWHQVTVTFGGSPFRAITIWVDGQQVDSGRCVKVPCVTKELDFFQGVTGKIAEVRMYDRILAADEIAALSIRK